jgi:hypothetical protein
MKLAFLPRSLRWIGYALFLPGLTLGILWGWAGFKPEWMSVRVFAVYSSYLRTVTMGMTRTNITDELAALLLLLGLLWLVFTKERNEGPETDHLRFRALALSLLLNSILLLFSILFIFGIGFIDVMIINLFSQLVIYLVAFRVMVARRD